MFIIECEFAKDISEYSFDGNRKQILLYPGRQFRVISSLNYGDQSKFIQLKEIRQSSPVIQIPKTASNRNYPMNRLESIIDQKSLNSIIDLNDQELTDKYMPTIVKDAIGTKQCVKLLLSNNKFTSNGSSILAKALDNNTTLTFLNLSYNNLSDEGVQYLTEILSRNNSKLEVLSLHRTGITDQCAPYLAKMLKKNTTLTWLHLGRNKISDQSMRHLTEVLIDHNKTLKVLDLSHNKSITDSSIDYLIEMLKSNISLETLWINNCKISNQEKKRLQKFVESRRRFFLLFVDDVPDHILKLSEKLTNNRRQ
jgi:Ran GTPase-activating protein (RanGAP) involved in mRNA processing and transport